MPGFACVLFYKIACQGISAVAAALNIDRAIGKADIFDPCQSFGGYFLIVDGHGVGKGECKVVVISSRQSGVVCGRWEYGVVMVGVERRVHVETENVVARIQRI